MEQEELTTEQLEELVEQGQPVPYNWSYAEFKFHVGYAPIAEQRRLILENPPEVYDPYYRFERR